jgi:hypothetical protein
MVELIAPASDSHVGASKIVSELHARRIRPFFARVAKQIFNVRRGWSFRRFRPVSDLVSPVGEPGKTGMGRFISAPVAVFLGALFLAWPAIYNGFPLIYPDTTDYINGGRLIATALIRHHPSPYYGLRSTIYSLGILPFHLGVTLWPVVALQCLLVSYVLWLVVRSLVSRKPAARFLILMLLLSLLSSVSWFASFVMPDILGPVLYLCVYLLVFARESLSRLERLALCLISSWAIASHSSHLLIFASLCFFLVLLSIRHFNRAQLRVGLELTAILALAVGAQAALNGILYGRFSQGVSRVPFVTARLIADGPGRWYLEKHCGEPRWEMCKYVSNISGTSTRFLFDVNGVWANASADSQNRILQQEPSFALAAVRAYPLEQAEKSASNFFSQLITFDLESLRPHPLVEIQIPRDLPRTQRQYFEGRQARNQLPLTLFTFIQYGGVVASLLCIAALVPWLWRSRPARLLGLGLVIAHTVVVNALVTGVLASVLDRFEGRVIWLVPLLAALCAFSWQESHAAASTRA